MTLFRSLTCKGYSKAIPFSAASRPLLQLRHQFPVSQKYCRLASTSSAAVAIRLKPTTTTLSNEIPSVMDAKVKQQYLADSPPTVVRLEIKPHFEALDDQQKRYAHFISRLVGLRSYVVSLTRLCLRSAARLLYLMFPLRTCLDDPSPKYAQPVHCSFKTDDATGRLSKELGSLYVKSLRNPNLSTT